MAQYFWTPDPNDLGGPPTGWSVYWVGLDNLEVKQDGAGDYYLEIAHAEQSRAFAALETLDSVDLTSITDADLFSEVEFENAEAEASMASRADNSGNDGTDAHGYRIGLENNTVQINGYVSGSSNGYASESAGYTSGQRVRQRSRVVSTNQKVRWWDAANTEPSTWDLETTNSDITTAGAVGFIGWLNNPTPNIVRVYSFGIGTDGDSAPTEPVSGGTPVNVDISAGTLSLSGQSLQAQAGAQPDIATGSLLFTGQSQAVAAGASSDIQVGTLTLTPQALAIQHGVSATIGAGSLSLTGQSLTVTTGESQAVSVDIQPGTLSLSPQALAVQHGQSVDVGAGSLTLSGLAQQIAAGASVDVQAGTLSIAGQSVETAQGVSIDIQRGNITLSGQGVEATRGQSLEIGAGTLTLTGNSLSVVVAEIETPDGRTLVIPMDARTLQITAEDRELTIPDEVRSIKIH